VISFVSLLVSAAVAFQILDALWTFRDKDITMMDVVPDPAGLYSVAFLNLQGLGLATGTWYAWIPVIICPKVESPDDIQQITPTRQRQQLKDSSDSSIQ